MSLTRIVPCLLIDNQDLYKTINFKNPKYLGDPFNTIKLFNGKEVDEIIILDIGATRDKRKPDFNFIRKLSNECFMPICYGGGLNDINDVEKVFKLGVDKVSFNYALHNNLNLVVETVYRYGSQAVVASIDYKKIGTDYFVFINNGNINTKIKLFDFVNSIIKTGVGEILLTSIDKEGTYSGYDEVSFYVCSLVDIPVAVNGGANSTEEMLQALKRGASAAVAGSLFSYFGKNKAVLPNYPKLDLGN